jgi:adsorption protein B
VDAVARRHPSVHKVVVPHDGPTSKADCLNAVWREVLAEEARRGIRYDILLMHDAEDVIHPLALRLYAALMPRHEFVQTPVFSLDRRPGQWVAGTYLDEFAEHHLKELPVRAAVGGLVPSAGVGSAFYRAAFEEIALAHHHRLFDPESLTEDYEIGLKFRLAGKRVQFACLAVERGAPGDRRRAGGDVVATREYFPSALGASVRQRSRWILGITLQTWAKVGWTGNLAVRWSLWRDRKGLFLAGVLALAYALLLWAGLRWVAAALGGPAFDPALVLGAGGPLGAVLAANAVGLGWRCAVKAWFVGRLYGPVQALLAAPRMVVGNVILLAATARAARQWARHRLLGEPLRWVKTAHEFPASAAPEPVALPADLPGLPG